MTEFVEVGPEGAVTSWAWCGASGGGQPFDRPFAWALVTLDGADVPFLHALDVDSPDDVHTGMRVQVRWADVRIGAITDIVGLDTARSSRGLLQKPSLVE